MSFVRSRISFNKLSGPLPNLEKQGKLTSLHISGSGLDLSGGIAYIYNTLTNLESLAVASMNLAGDITTVCDFSKLTKLTFINLQNNKLTGSIPSITALTKLNNLFVDDSQ